MRELCVAWFSTQTKQTAQGNLKKPTRQNVIDWVSAAWESINPQTNVQSFLLCGISAHIDGSNNDKMFKHIPHVLPAVVEDTDNSDHEEEEVDGSEHDDADDGMITRDDFDGFESNDEYLFDDF